jgi:hypothetical protein
VRRSSSHYSCQTDQSYHLGAAGPSAFLNRARVGAGRAFGSIPETMCRAGADEPGAIRRSDRPRRTTTGKIRPAGSGTGRAPAGSICPRRNTVSRRPGHRRRSWRTGSSSRPTANARKARTLALLSICKKPVSVYRVSATRFPRAYGASNGDDFGCDAGRPAAWRVPVTSPAEAAGRPARLAGCTPGRYFAGRGGRASSRRTSAESRYGIIQAYRSSVGPADVPLRVLIPAEPVVRSHSAASVRGGTSHRRRCRWWGSGRRCPRAVCVCGQITAPGADTSGIVGRVAVLWVRNSPGDRPLLSPGRRVSRRPVDQGNRP